VKTKLTLDERLTYGKALADQLRKLRVSKVSVTYKTVALEIGLMKPDERWGAYHRTQITQLLNMIAAVDKFGNATPEFADEDYRWIVTEANGEPGQGFYSSSRIVTTEQQRQAVAVRWADPKARKAASRRMKARWEKVREVEGADS
jgi:hypothetical protein